MFVDQFPKNDMSRDLAKKHNFTIYDSIDGALTLGGKQAGGRWRPVHRRARQVSHQRPRADPVSAAALLRGRHRRLRQVPPVACRSSTTSIWPTTGPTRWMYDRARELMVPFMAGSSLPVTWRRPSLRLDRRTASWWRLCRSATARSRATASTPWKDCNAWPSGARGGETGVRAVTVSARRGDVAGHGSRPWSRRSCSNAAMEHVSGPRRGRLSQDHGEDQRRRRLPHRVSRRLQGGGGDAQRLGLRGRRRRLHVSPAGCAARTSPASTHFYLQQPDPFAHFAYLVRAIDSMIQTGHAVYPGGAHPADDGHSRCGDDQQRARRTAASRRRIWTFATSRPTGVSRSIRRRAPSNAKPILPFSARLPSVARNDWRPSSK